MAFAYAGDGPWTASALVAGDAVHIPEASVEFPIEALYAGTDPATADGSGHEADTEQDG